MDRKTESVSRPDGKNGVRAGKKYIRNSDRIAADTYSMEYQFGKYPYFSP